MLNHATNRVNDSEREKKSSAEEHRKKSRAYQKAENRFVFILRIMWEPIVSTITLIFRVQDLQRSCKRAISKSRPYFEAKARYNQRLDDQKRQARTFPKNGG